MYVVMKGFPINTERLKQFKCINNISLTIDQLSMEVLSDVCVREPVIRLTHPLITANFGQSCQLLEKIIK